jgi:hypothetical protein
MKNGIYNGDYFIGETPVNPELREESYCDVKMPYGNRDVMATPMSFNT